MFKFSQGSIAYISERRRTDWRDSSWLTVQFFDDAGVHYLSELYNCVVYMQYFQTIIGEDMNSGRNNNRDVA